MQEKTLNYTWARFVKLGKYACHVLQKVRQPQRISWGIAVGEADSL